MDNIFFKMIRIRVNFIMSMSSVRLRKGKRQGSVFTAKELKNKASREDLLKCDIGFKDLKALRNSPHYTEQGKKDIYAFFRQLGTATFFITNSMADTRWRELLVILSLLVDKKVISEADVDLMDTPTCKRLMSSDPVTCARYFRHSMDSLLTSICSCDEIIGEMNDFFLRDEFQQRGSPHSHWLAFIKNAPVYGRAPDSEIYKFVDKYIRCHRDPKMDAELIKLQEHRHSGSCYRRETGCLPHCRFRYPRPPMQTTKTLTPLPDDMSKEESKALRKKWNLIFERLKEIYQAKELFDIELSDFFADEKLTEEEYLLALRSSLTRPTLFLARRLSEMRMNSYNKVILEMTCANMDIQFCLDPYAAATYVASYMMKGQRGMSKAMSAACSEAQAGNLGIKEVVRHMGNVFSRASEVSAQETVYHCLGLPFKRSSRACKFIPTSPPTDCTFMARQDRDLKNLDDDSTDIAYPSLVDKNANRPSELHPLSFAEQCGLV
jgi:hypothetical protein